MKHDEITKPDVVEQNQDILFTRAQLDVGTYDVESNTVSVIFGTDEPCLVKGHDGEPFWQVLSFDPAHINLRRLSSGAPVLDNHMRDGSVMKVTLGVVEDPQINGTYGTARLRFSPRKDLDDFRNDVRSGIHKNVSAGFRVKLYRDITQPDDIYRRLLAIDWEPSEISMVPVNEDWKSQVRSQAEIIEQPIIENKQITETHERAMSVVETPEAKSQREAAELQAKNDVLNDRKRSQEIREIANGAGFDEVFITQHVDGNSTVDHVRKLAFDHFVSKKQVEINPVTTTITVGADHERSQKLAGLSEALVIREGEVPQGGPKTELGKIAMVRRIHLMEHARSYVALTGVPNVELLPDGEVYHRAMTTTDFPMALANIMNKKLRAAYVNELPVWEKFATKISANDFKDINSVQVDGSFIPDRLTEQGEYTEASFKEVADKFKLYSWGKMVKLSRQLIINDDLSAFQNNASKFAKGFVNRKAQIVYNLLEGNNKTGRVLGSDGLPLFSAQHNNFDAIGAAMSLNSFKKAKLSMRRQKDLSGEPIRVTPKYLVIPPELEILADQLINSTTTPNSTSQANPFKGAFEILVDEFLTDTQAWYIIADPSQIEVIKYATLAGQEGIYTEQMYDFNTDELKVKARTDFNATIEEYRGIYKNVGVADNS